MVHILLLYRIHSSNHEPKSANKNLVEKNKRWISQKDESKDIVKKMINIKVSFSVDSWYVGTILKVNHPSLSKLYQRVNGQELDHPTRISGFNVISRIRFQ